MKAYMDLLVKYLATVCIKAIKEPITIKAYSSLKAGGEIIGELYSIYPTTMIRATHHSSQVEALDHMLSVLLEYFFKYWHLRPNKDMPCGQQWKPAVIPWSLHEPFVALRGRDTIINDVMHAIIL